jgi:uncharacterized protein (UPF0332 family)
MNSFIKKLIKKSIKLTEPSDQICKSYLDKSDKSLFSSKTLLNIDNFDDATALTYYSMYYSILASLYKVGIKSENHTATIILLKEIFNIDNNKILQAKKDRVDKQYYVDFKATKEEVEEGIQIAEEFNSKIKEIIDKITKSEIKKIKEKFEEDYFTS